MRYLCTRRHGCSSPLCVQLALKRRGDTQLLSQMLRATKYDKLSDASLLEAIRDPEHPEHDEMVEWVGDEFDPEAFDLDEVNRELHHLT